MIQFEMIDVKELQELVKDHVRNILVEFQPDDSDDSQERVKGLAILAQMAASMIQHATREIVKELSGMPEYVAEQLHQTSKDLGEMIAKDLREEFEVITPEQRQYEHVRTIKGGDA